MPGGWASLFSPHCNYHMVEQTCMGEVPLVNVELEPLLSVFSDGLSSH